MTGHRDSVLRGRPDRTVSPSLCNWQQSQAKDCTASLDAAARFRSASSAHPSLRRHVPTAHSPPLRLSHHEAGRSVPGDGGGGRVRSPGRRGRRVKCRRPRVPRAGDHLRRAGRATCCTRPRAATDDRRLAWLSVGTTLAFIGLLTTLFALPSLFPDGGISRAERGRRRRALPDLARRADRRGRLALAGLEPRLRTLLIFGGLGALLLAWAAVASSPLGDLASGDGFSPTMRALVALIVIAQAGVAALWWRRAGGAVSWADMCVLAMMILSALDAFAYMWASEPVRRLLVGEPRAARRPVRDPRRRPADRLHRRRREAARVRGRADREPGRRARARARRRRSASRSTSSAASGSARACRR